MKLIIEEGNISPSMIKDIHWLLISIVVICSLTFPSYLIDIFASLRFSYLYHVLGARQ